MNSNYLVASKVNMYLSTEGVPLNFQVQFFLFYTECSNNNEWKEAKEVLLSGEDGTSNRTTVVL